MGTTREERGWRYVVRVGAVAAEDEERPIGSRLWLYSNFDCNLACDYCCATSSPSAPREALGLERVRAIAEEAKDLGVADLLVTGGEPFLLEDIGAILLACAGAARTTELTNGMLFAGRRREALASLPRDRVVLQVSLDSPGPALHDRHRGEGTWEKAVRGIAVARELGFRVRVAATVATDDEERDLDGYFAREAIAEEDRVVRRIALRGLAEDGVALARGDLRPEPTITADGVYWHPVGATDDDFFVTADPCRSRALRAGAGRVGRGAALRHHARQRLLLRLEGGAQGPTIGGTGPPVKWQALQSALGASSRIATEFPSGP